MTHTRLLAGPLALAAVLLLALGVAACGSDESGGNATAGQDQAQTQDQGDGGSGQPEQEIRAMFQDLQDAFSERDAKGICDRLTPEAQKKTGRDGAPEYPTCPAVAKAMFAEYGPNIRRNAKIIRLRVLGDRAIATVTAGETLELSTPFAKTDDGWKMDRSLIPQPN